MSMKVDPSFRHVVMGVFRNARVRVAGANAEHSRPELLGSFTGTLGSCVGTWKCIGY